MLMEYLTACAIVCSILLAIYFYLVDQYSFWRKKNVPGPKPSLLFGNFHDESHIFAHKKWIEEYGRVVGTFDMSSPRLIVADADLVKQMLVRDFNALSDRRNEGFDHPIEQKFTFIQDGETWKRNRGVMSPAFTSSKFKNIFQQIDICSDKLVDHLDQLIAAGRAKDIEAVDLFKNYGSDVMSRSILNASFIQSYSAPNKMTDGILHYFYADKYKMVLSGLLPKWFKSMINFSIFNMKGLRSSIILLEKVIEQRKNSLDQSQVDLLRIMIEGAEKVNWDKDDIISNLLIMYAAGLHASVVLLSNVLYHCIRYPHIRENIINEINEVEAEGQKLSFETVTNGFKYLEAVICETLRLCPTSTYTERRVRAKEYTFEYNGQSITLPRGTDIWFPIYVVHRDPEYFAEPEKFDESRFLPENKDNLHPYSFFPFGQGPRICIGMRFAMVSTKTAMIKIIKKFNFKLVDESFDPMDFSGVVDEFLVTKPVRVKFERSE